MCAAFVGVMAFSLWQRGLSFTSSVGALLGLGVWQAFSLLINWARKSQLKLGSSTPEQKLQAAQALAGQERRQWDEEVALRGIADSDPLAVQWMPASYEVTDHTAIVGGVVYGNTSNIAGLLSSIRALKYQRLVILGPTGVGKTALAVLLTQEILRTRRSSEPVPVLLSLSSWNPRRETLKAWLHKRISEDCSALRDAASYGPTAIMDLIDNGMIMPILDGLDELPTGCLPEALRRINQALSHFSAIIVTSTTDAFEYAVQEAGVISGAAVIKPLPVEPVAVVDFLRNSTSPADLPQWYSVFEHISKNSRGPLAIALSNPLMASLASIIYAERRNNPAELIDVRRFPDQAAIETHLLDEFIPSLIEQDGARDDPVRSWDWDSRSATKWLGFLAEYLHSHGTYDFAWWSLYRALLMFRTARVQRRAFVPAVLAFILVAAAHLPFHSVLYSCLTGLAYGLIVGVACLLARSSSVGNAHLTSRPKPLKRMFDLGIAAAFAFGIPIGLRTALSGGLSVGLRTGAADGLVAGLVVVLGADIAGIPTPPDSPIRVDFHFRGRGSSLVRTLGIGVRAGILFGFVTGILAVFRHQHLSGSALWNALLSGVVVGLVFGIGSWLISWTRTPVKSDEARSPAATLRADRTAVLLLSMLLSLTLGAAFGLTAALNYDIPGTVANALVGVLMGLLSSPWPLYFATSKYLALRTRLPFSLMTFLDECHRLGILRRVGPIYQFRHSRLQQHLCHRQTLKLSPDDKPMSEFRGGSHART